jgi:hypothetical protein
MPAASAQLLRFSFVDVSEGANYSREYIALSLCTTLLVHGN